MEITTPKTPSQEIAHGEYIRRLNVLELDGNTDPLDTKAVYGNDTDAIELKDFKTSILNIEHKTSAIYNNMCTQEAHNIVPTKKADIRSKNQPPGHRSKTRGRYRNL